MMKPVVRVSCFSVLEILMAPKGLASELGVKKGHADIAFQSCEDDVQWEQAEISPRPPKIPLGMYRMPAIDWKTSDPLYFEGENCSPGDTVPLVIFRF